MIQTTSPDSTFIIIYQKSQPEFEFQYGIHTLVYYIAPNPDLCFKYVFKAMCLQTKSKRQILILISKDPHLMDEDSNPNPRID